METYDPFPRPGDPDFASFPKEPSDDAISYSVYLPRAFKLKPAERRARLNEILSTAHRLALKLLKGFIWQRDAFQLKFDDSGTSHLEGVTEYGDSATDEWIVVYILRELSRSFEDAWIRVSDNDGEFLLIEAANVLPAWLDPDIADHRVWLNQGQLYLIHPPASGDSGQQPAKTLSLEAALTIISAQSSQLKHVPVMQEQAFQRLNAFPSAIAQSMHRRQLLIPRRLAYVLHRLPYTSSAATESFFLRDKGSAKFLYEPSSNQLQFPPSDMVQMSVQFNKVSYAQLMSQELQPPQGWITTLQGNRAASSLQSAEVGMKLTCGFELMLADANSQDKRITREIQILLEDLDAGDDSLPSDEDMQGWPHDNDDDSWLDVNFEDFQNELAGRKSSKDAKQPPVMKDEATQANFKRIVDNFEKFLADEDAGAEGAEDFKHQGGNSDDEHADDDNDEDDDEEDEVVDDDSRAEFPSDLGGFDKKRDAKAFKEAIQMLVGLEEQGFVDRPHSQDEETGGPDFAETLAGHELSSDDEDGEDIDFKDLQQLTEQMEAELRRSGSLSNTDMGSTSNAGDSSHHDDPRLALAKNLLESLRHSGGQGGPAASMLASMGLNLPHDEDE